VKVVARIEDPGVYPSRSPTPCIVARATAAGLKAHGGTALRCDLDPVPTAAPGAAARVVLDRRLLWGANTPWKRVRFTRGFGTSAIGAHRSPPWRNP